MEAITASAEVDAAREAFFKIVFGRYTGYICLAYLRPKDRSSFREEFFKYPDQLPQMLTAINEHVMGHNIYFCPQLLSEGRRLKENVIATPNAWSDLDSCEPDNLYVEPTIVVESSPGSFQAYWVFDREIDPDDAEDLSRRIAYKHAEEGADRSGWDLTQLLRVPTTYNYKHTVGTHTPIVKAIHISPKKYRLADFSDNYPPVVSYQHIDIPMPEESALPQSAEDLLNDRRMSLNAKIWSLYMNEPEGDWSRPLWNLQMMLFEADFTREEVYVVAREAKCNKYARDGKPAQLLWKDVCRAAAKNEANIRLLHQGVANDKEMSLLSDEERLIVSQQEDTFIERYIAWASKLGDAAAQYHQAGAFVALSSLLAGNVRLPTSFGTIIPNLWFMILADTTLTRKTTSMDIAMDIVTEIDSDALLATDGSIEGLLTSMASRPGRPGVFLRDEFSGLLEMMTKKDYYAGMSELLTKLYDGKMQKRVLRKEIVEVREPVLIVFAGGIKNKITSLLSWEHVSSGFMPRFVFITAESDVTKLKPLGPPTGNTKDNGQAIKDELTDIYTHYGKTVSLSIKKLNAEIETKKRWEAELTTDAWVRYNQLETQMVETALKSERPEVMTPTYDRLSKSILKAAVLLSAARQRSEKVVVEETDILRAAMYGEQWRVHVREVMNNVGKGTYERSLDKIVSMIKTNPGTPRSKVMQYYHLTARDTSQLLETLEQRGLIRRQKAGRTEFLYPLDV